MRTIIAGVCMCCCASSAAGMLTVSSFRAGAGTNAFAPLDKSKYFDEQYVENLSPAIVNASGDWLGTNFGGVTDTWHWVGTADASISTVASPNDLAVKGDGSFRREITTTDEFVGPNSQSVVYAPGSGANYSCFFSLTQDSVFTLSGNLSRYSRFRLYSFTEGITAFSKTNVAAAPIVVNVTGTLPPGEYSVGVDTGLAGTVNLGAAHTVHSGGFTDFLFTVQVPEPAGGMAMALAGGMLLRRRRR